jgi:hypothetical protein
MLRACALQYGRSWDKSLSYAEFSYNNSYCRGFMTGFEGGVLTDAMNNGT